MNNYSVLETNTIEKTVLRSKDGRCHEIHEIACDSFDFLPGQFVMIQIKTDSFHWSYPYMILDKTCRGFKVTSVERSSLYGKPAGTRLVLWGANGNGIKTSSCTLVAEAATCFLTAPFSSAYPSCQMLFFGSRESAVEQACPKETQYISSPGQIATILEASTGQVLMALNLPTLTAIMKDASLCLKSRTLVFASVDIACGVNACKGCYLHSPSIAVGIPVCCHGPYLPYDEIDFETDAKCFHYFQ